MPKVLIVSNRLPVTVRPGPDGPTLEPSTGGLATGLAPLMAGGDVEWLGWPGALPRIRARERLRVAQELLRHRLHQVDIPAEQFDPYYNAVSNGALWPLYHYQTERMPLKLNGWSEYVAVNRRFADAAAERTCDDDLVWVHDYHLQLVPRQLRELRPNARIGFFLHIPFPSSEIFRLLPWRAELLEGLLGADLIGFHTHAYLRHFASAALRVLGADVEGTTVGYGGRRIRLGVFPLGVQAAPAGATAVDEGPATSELADALRRFKEKPEVAHVLLAVDRLDYTKGIPRRLLAVEDLLERRPELRGKIVLVQIAAPSRDDVPAYNRYKRKVEEQVGRINGRFGMPGYQPIHYVARALPPAEVRTLYRLADVMVVTPLRDGMNLVAKEFVEARADHDGVLVLSEMAGASAELGEAVLVNPFDVAGTADGLHAALTMPKEEREARMKALRRRITTFDAATWGRSFLGLLGRLKRDEAPPRYAAVDELVAAVAGERRISIFLDYDGTLYPIVRIPELAKPDEGLKALLAQVARHPRLDVHLVSGRSADVMEGWFKGLGLNLHAEHGAASLMRDAPAWVRAAPPLTRVTWVNVVRPVLDEFARNTPGAFVEAKEHSLAWHYRMADPEHGERMANELRLHARETFAPMGLDVMSGRKVLEIRPSGINKGGVVRAVLGDEARRENLAVAVGDDTTDEDMFAALPAGGIAVVVGDRTSRARFRLRGPAEVRAWLSRLVMPMVERSGS